MTFHEQEGTKNEHVLKAKLIHDMLISYDPDSEPYVGVFKGGFVQVRL